MENTEKLISHIQMRLAQQHYVALSWELTMLDKMLKALPSYEEDKVYDIICADDELFEIEDPAMYRTFDSSEFHVGDEILTKYGTKCIVLYVSELGLVSIGSDMLIHNFDKSPYIVKRTGRNFPAIENILNILKKSEVENEP